MQRNAFIGVPDPTINFCEEALQLFGSQTCTGINIESISAEPYDNPSQANELFVNQILSDSNPLIYDLIDDVGSFGFWTITYTDTASLVVKEQYLYIEYPCRSVELTFLGPFNGEFYSNYADLRKAETRQYEIDSFV